MRTVKQLLIILLVLLTAGHIVTAVYQGSSDRKIGPKISCPEGILEISASDPESKLLEGVTATDEQDGDLTGQIILGGVSKLITEDTAKVTLLVFDSDDNMGAYTRYIRYTDYRRPWFTVTQPLVFSTTESVSILDRITAHDVVDGDLTEAIRVSTMDASSHSQIYSITVQVTNTLGDTAWLRLPVLLLESDPLRPSINLNNYLIYLEPNSEFDPQSLLASVSDPSGAADLANVQIDSNVDTSAKGTYQVTYTYNSDGRVGIAIATVVVQ